MKKSILFLAACFLLTGMAVNGQTNKGNVFLAGNSDLGLCFGKEKYKSGDTKEDQSKYSNFDINILAGYFFINHLTAGLYMDYGYDLSKNISNDNKYSSAFFAIGPFARYYFLDLNKIRPFGHAQVGLGVYRDKYTYGDNENKYKEGYFTYFLGAGADFFLNDRVALDLLLGFEHETYNHKIEEGEERSQDSEKFIYNSFVIKLGIAVILGKNL